MFAQPTASADAPSAALSAAPRRRVIHRITLSARCRFIPCRRSRVVRTGAGLRLSLEWIHRRRALESHLDDAPENACAVAHGVEIGTPSAARHAPDRDFDD